MHLRLMYGILSMLYILGPWVVLCFAWLNAPNFRIRGWQRTSEGETVQMIDRLGKSECMLFFQCCSNAVLSCHAQVCPFLGSLHPCWIFVDNGFACREYNKDEPKRKAFQWKLVSIYTFNSLISYISSHAFIYNYLCQIVIKNIWLFLASLHGSHQTTNWKQHSKLI